MLDHPMLDLKPHPPPSNDCRFGYFCDNGLSAGVQHKRATQCSAPPHADLRCFTSEDSNWTLNAVLMKRKQLLETITDRHPRAPWKTLPEFGLQCWDGQSCLEVEMLNQDWGKHHVPLCLSRQGIFLHRDLRG